VTGKKEDIVYHNRMEVFVNMEFTMAELEYVL
jgi:hypothetical protein